MINMKNVIPKILGRSQKGQDSFIDEVFKAITPKNKFFVEFGAYNGVDFLNSYYLKHSQNWTGVMFDPEFHNPEIGLYKEFLTSENVLQIFDKYNIPLDFDFLSIDIDGNDYWILKEIISKYYPACIMIECNIRFDCNTSMVQKYNPLYKWNGRDWYGASPLAINKLVKDKYTIVHIHLDDAILIRNDLLDNAQINIDLCQLYKPDMDLYASHNSGELIIKDWMEV